MVFIWGIGMKGRRAASTWDTRPKGTELQKLVEDFGADLKEPDEQHALWGYKWVLSYPGNELPLSEEGQFWAHFGMYVCWQSDIALLCRCITAKYPEMGSIERSSIRTWVERGASWDDLPTSLGSEVMNERLQSGDSWSREWLAEARKHTSDPAFFGHTRKVDRLLEIVDRLDIKAERRALDTALPSSRAADPLQTRL